MRKVLFFLSIILLLAACKSPPQVVEEPVVVIPEPVIEIVQEPEPEPEPEIEVLEPLFEIVSIAIIRGELINTQFEAVLRIDNPNVFDVDLSQLSYVLYGNGLFWADGKENDIFHVPAKSFSENKFYFTMNFINMNRRLLDDVIAMRQVQYRFSGDALVQAGIPRAPSFKMDYDISGYSEVKPVAD